jgi:hypothetical protein
MKYKQINYFNVLQDQNRLHENEMLLVFNIKRYEPKRKRIFAHRHKTLSTCKTV